MKYESIINQLSTLSMKAESLFVQYHENDDAKIAAVAAKLLAALEELHEAEMLLSE